MYNYNVCNTFYQQFLLKFSTGGEKSVDNYDIIEMVVVLDQHKVLASTYQREERVLVKFGMIYPALYPVHITIRSSYGKVNLL